MERKGWQVAPERKGRRSSRRSFLKRGLVGWSQGEPLASDQAVWAVVMDHPGKGVASMVDTEDQRLGEIRD